MKHVDVYTDGACRGNPGRGGWGAVLVYRGQEKELSGGDIVKEANRIITEYKTGRKRKKRLPFSPLSFFLGMLAASVLAGILLLIFSVVF